MERVAARRAECRLQRQQLQQQQDQGSNDAERDEERATVRVSGSTRTLQDCQGEFSDDKTTTITTTNTTTSIRQQVCEIKIV